MAVSAQLAKRGGKDQTDVPLDQFGESRLGPFFCIAVEQLRVMAHFKVSKLAATDRRKRAENRLTGQPKVPLSLSQFGPYPALPTGQGPLGGCGGCADFGRDRRLLASRTPDNPRRMVSSKVSFLIFALLVVGSRSSLQATPSPLSEPIDGDAILETWIPPEYPRDTQKVGLTGTVTLRLSIDKKGDVVSSRVLDASDPRFISAAQSAVKKWKFSPALNNSAPVACSMDVPVGFSPEIFARKGATAAFPPDGQWPVPAAITEAKLISSPDIEYPESLYDRRLSGLAHYFCTVLPDGSVTNPRISFATHVDFVLPAVRALERLRYHPRMKGDVPIAAEVEGILRFDLIGSSKANPLEANFISAADAGIPTPQIEPLVMVDPVMPYDLALKGEEGTATVTFSLNSIGNPIDIRVRDASEPEFGAALAAATEMCSFSAPANEGRSMPLLLIRRAKFSLGPSQDSGAENSLSGLLSRAKEKRISGAGNLDRKIAPVYEMAPKYPGALESSGRLPGSAVIEFLVDREGRARFPNIVSASDSRFGWSAATAVSQWVFEVPFRGGQPVDVRVQVPFQFKVPTE